MDKLVSSSNLSTFASSFSNLIKEKYDPFITDIDYESLLAFDTSEIIFRSNDTSPIFVYYNSIESSITDIANNSIGLNSITQDMNPEVAVYNFEDVTYLILLRNCKIESTIIINNDIVLMLNGYEINASDTSAIQIKANKVIIDGRANGSKINVDTSIEANNIAAIQLISGECTINGGEVNSLTAKAGERDNPNGMIVTESNTTLTINNVKLLAKDEIGGAINAVLVNENSTLIANNCNIVVDSKSGLSPDAIYSYGNIELNNCYIEGKSDHVANAAGNDYGATSRGVNSQAGSANIINCNVKGTHSGMTAKGDLFVKDSVFESYSHGGIYVSSEDKTVYLSNSIIRQCEMPDGYVTDSIAGTNNAGMYVGGASNITLYVDGCTFYGIQQPIVLRGSSGESNNHLYISNSNINLDYKNYGIRNDGSHQTHFGIGNNFGPANLRYNRNYEETDIDYGETIDNH